METQTLLKTIYETQLKQNDEIAALKGTVKDIDDKVTYTNGKVAALIEDKIRRDERHRTLKEVKSSGSKPSNKQWFEDKAVRNLIIALAALIPIVGSFIATRSGL